MLLLNSIRGSKKKYEEEIKSKQKKIKFIQVVAHHPAVRFCLNVSSNFFFSFSSSSASHQTFKPKFFFFFYCIGQWPPLLALLSEKKNNESSWFAGKKNFPRKAHEYLSRFLLSLPSPFCSFYSCPFTNSKTERTKGNKWREDFNKGINHRAEWIQFCGRQT